MTSPPTLRTRRRGPRRPPSGRRHPVRALLRAVSWHRRPLAAVAAALAVLTGLTAALPEGPPERTVLVAARPVAGGTVLTGADLALRSRRAADLPVGALGTPEQAVGRAVSAPVPEGQVLTPAALVAPRASPAVGRVVAPVRLSDPGLVTLLRPGDVLDLVGADEQGAGSSVVARGARVVAVPQLDAEVADGSIGGLVLVEVPSRTATDLARAAVAGPVSPIWR